MGALDSGDVFKVVGAEVYTNRSYCYSLEITTSEPRSEQRVPFTYQIIPTSLPLYAAGQSLVPKDVQTLIDW